MSNRTTRLSRRNFLLTLGAGGAAPAAANGATNPGSESLKKGKDKRASRGYQASEHVNNYYRTAKV